jgi:riboflavin synthase
MFTGLIESVGRVSRIEQTADGFRIVVSTELSNELSMGESVAVNGVCLTVVGSGLDGMHADISPETARVTSLGGLTPGALVNLERSLRAGARIGGHFVQGHVDGTGRIERIQHSGDSHRITVSVPTDLAPYIVDKGSIAVDGISLTIAALAGNRIDLQIIPFTWEHTNLHAAAEGGPVNIECDILGKYVARALALGVRPAGPAA